MSRRKTSLACLALLAAPLAGCDDSRYEVGGIEEMATDSEAAREAARFAAAALDRDGTRWEVTVWDNPAGEMELTESRQGGEGA